MIGSSSFQDTFERAAGTVGEVGGVLRKPGGVSGVLRKPGGVGGAGSSEY
jgi:hypothetical protein